MAHYDLIPRRGRVSNAILRDRLFQAPDARGNIPHMTRETADHESRRINAGVYETVGQMDAALDARVDARLAPTPVTNAPPTRSGGSLLGSLALIGLGVAVAWVFLSSDDDGDDDAKDVTPRENPTPSTPSTVVVTPPAQTTTVTTNEAPVPVVVPPPKRRRRRAKPATITVETKSSPSVPVVVPVVPPTVPT